MIFECVCGNKKTQLDAANIFEAVQVFLERIEDTTLQWRIEEDRAIVSVKEPSEVCVISPLMSRRAV